MLATLGFNELVRVPAGMEATFKTLRALNAAFCQTLSTSASAA